MMGETMLVFIGIRDGEDEDGRPAYAYDAHAAIEAVPAVHRPGGWLVDVAGLADAVELLGVDEWDAGCMATGVERVHDVVVELLRGDVEDAREHLGDWSEHAVIWHEQMPEHLYRVNGDDELPAQRLRDLIGEYGESIHGQAMDPEDLWPAVFGEGATEETAGGEPVEPFVLVQENVRGGYWLSAHASPAEAAGYIDGEEYAHEWETVELVDLRTGGELSATSATTFG
jgi:hypothetical protein